LEDIALTKLYVIARDSRSKLALDLDREIEGALKHKEADEDGEVVIKTEELDDVNGVVMTKSERKTM